MTDPPAVKDGSLVGALDRALVGASDRALVGASDRALVGASDRALVGRIACALFDWADAIRPYRVWGTRRGFGRMACALQYLDQPDDAVDMIRHYTPSIQDCQIGECIAKLSL